MKTLLLCILSLPLLAQDVPTGGQVGPIRWERSFADHHIVTLTSEAKPLCFDKINVRIRFMGKDEEGNDDKKTVLASYELTPEEKASGLSQPRIINWSGIAKGPIILLDVRLWSKDAACVGKNGVYLP